jgi:hypothetical protein
MAEPVAVCAVASTHCCAASDQCPFINFLCSPMHAQAWHEADPDLKSALMDLAQAVDQGRRVFAPLLR